MKKKYLVIGGTVRSKNDGQLHYIGPHTLAALYRVRRSQCFLIRDDEKMDGVPDGLIVLRPREDGDYRPSSEADASTVVTG